jgi:hypothetical protein
MMRTPDRVDNMPSPPFFIVKNYDEDEELNQISTQVLPPPSTILVLSPIFKMMN